MLGKDGVPIYSSPALVQNSQITRALLYKWRDYPEKCRSKPVISRATLAVISRATHLYDTRALSYRCRGYSKKCLSKLDISPYLGIIPYYVAVSRTGPVITRTMSPWSTGGSEHARTYDNSHDNRRNVYENCTTIYGLVTRKAPPTLDAVMARFLNRLKSRRLSPTMYEIWRHVTRTADIGRHLFDFSTTCGEF